MDGIKLINYAYGKGTTKSTIKNSGIHIDEKYAVCKNMRQLVESSVTAVSCPPTSAVEG